MQLEARRYSLSGQVQGVGFRPFVYRLATELDLHGWVKNVAGRVEIHAEGEADALVRFATALIAQAPALAKPALAQMHSVPAVGLTDFQILHSDATTAADIHLPADQFVCDDCLAELRDPANRRYRYPFINCTQCGPRYTLIQALPYDRSNTAMRAFPLCAACAAEYSNPTDRRFHAEPIACPACGPHLHWKTTTAEVQQDDAGALDAAVTALRAGQIIAVKGIGGYHLLCDARNDDTIARLRARKPRPHKPLAVLFADLASLREAVLTTAADESVLMQSERPILLLPKRADCALSALIAPNLNEIGCLLPYSPLHAVLLDACQFPLVATSGNISGEPVLTSVAAADKRLAQIVDGWLHHNRPILRPADDSVYRVIQGRARPLRLGRGRAPVELQLPTKLPAPVLALGSHMKNTLCLAWDDRAVLSPHIGELDNALSLDTLAQVAADLQQLYQVEASRLLLDQHPGYGYRQFARKSGLPLSAIWHHHAHASALAWEFPQVSDWIVFAWDGVGLGADGTLWGGDAFIGKPGQWQRAAALRNMRIPGGDKAGREPWRAAAALMWESNQQAAMMPQEEYVLLHNAWQQGLNAPISSAAGRLFDGAAALTGLCTTASYEGEAPMRLEALAASYQGTVTPINMPLHQDDASVWRADWSALLPMLCDANRSQSERAACFHSSLAESVRAQAHLLRQATGSTHVGLTGGVFQNRVLTEQVIKLLTQDGFTACLPQRLPVNDAVISFGQVIEWLSLATSGNHL